MPTYQIAHKSVNEMAAKLCHEYATNQPLVDAGVLIDFLYAFPTLGEDGEPTGNAITHHGHAALGLCRIINLKDRTKDNADAEILLDGDWWANATEKQQRALLDHELHHLEVKLDKEGRLCRDDLGRPKLKMRKHDYDLGFFNIIAQRHGADSQEQIQAKAIFDDAGQLYWPCLEGGGTPEIAESGSGNTITISSGGTSVTLSPAQLKRAASRARSGQPMEAA